MRYKGSLLLDAYEKRFIRGGDFVNHDGTGSSTVYEGEDSISMPAEKNNQLKFCEPYLLAMSANAERRTGCQFFITLDELPALDGSDHTIFGRLIKGTDTLNIIEGIDEYRITKNEIKERI